MFAAANAAKLRQRKTTVNVARQTAPCISIRKMEVCLFGMLKAVNKRSCCKRRTVATFLTAISPGAPTVNSFPSSRSIKPMSGSGQYWYRKTRPTQASRNAVLHESAESWSRGESASSMSKERRIAGCRSTSQTKGSISVRSIGYQTPTNCLSKHSAASATKENS